MEADPAAAPKLAELVRTLDVRPVSVLSCHPGPWCRSAQAWFRAVARVAARVLGPEPRWITERWTWGPVRWPLAWCEAVRRRELDCGALAHLAAVAFREAGHEVVRVELVEEVEAERIAHWAARWAAVAGAPLWIWGEFVYHEEVGVVHGGRVRLWNPTEGYWRKATVGRLRALRIAAEADGPVRIVQELLWGCHALPVRRWVAVSGDKEGCGTAAGRRSE